MKPILAALLLIATPVAAQDLTSQYTRLDQDSDCNTIARSAEDDGDWADLVCPGFAGYPYVIRYGDGRETVTYGFATEPGMPSFGRFNYSNGTVEWRLRADNGGERPVAAIQRWYLADIDGNWATQILVVSKVGQPEQGGEACVIGYVDAADGAEGSANERARDISDGAESFACGDDRPEVEPGIAEFVSPE